MKQLKNGIVSKGNPFLQSGLEGGIVKAMTKTKVQTRNGRLYASSAGQCVRRNVLHTSQAFSSTWDAAAEVYASIGKAVHETIQDALFSNGTLLYSEYHLPEIPGLNLGGYVDAIAVVDGKVSVVEIKTCGKIPSAPRSEHRDQAVIYSAITGFPAYVLYQSREVADYSKRLNIKSYRVSTTDDDLVDIMTRLFTSARLISAELTPPIPAKFRSERDCGFCPFKSICWSGQETSWPEVRSEQYEEIISLAQDDATRIIDDRRFRRNGILKFLSLHGTTHAKKLLAGDWRTLLED